jgi:membrane associated rhomboid family serine protease
MLNVPGVVTGLVATFAVIHALRVWVLTPRGYLELLKQFSFVPARYESAAQCGVPDRFAVKAWTFVSYAFLHGDLTHIGVNVVWFLAFGSPVARRFGALRFLLFFAVTAAAGAVAHLVAHPNECLPMVGASAAISGCMAAAIRFVFQAGGPLGLWRTHEAHAYHVPAAPLKAALTDPRILAFLIVWFGLNLLLGLGSLSLLGENQQLAWEAHIGGFLAGLILFPWFDPVPRANGVDQGRGGDPATDLN